MGPNSTGLTKKGNLDINTSTHTGRMPCEFDNGNPQAKERGLVQILSSQPSEGTNSPTTCFRTSTLKNRDTINFCSLSHPVMALCYSSSRNSYTGPSFLFRLLSGSAFENCPTLNDCGRVVRDSVMSMFLSSGVPILFSHLLNSCDHLTLPLQDMFRFSWLD